MTKWCLIYCLIRHDCQMKINIFPLIFIRFIRENSTPLNFKAIIERGEFAGVDCSHIFGAGEASKLISPPSSNFSRRYV